MSTGRWRCEDCGSHAISLEAFVAQDPASGKLEVVDVCDKGHRCQDCESERVRWEEPAPAASSLKGAVITVKPTGLRWRINQAASLNDARDAIYEAMATGSVGLIAGLISGDEAERIIADVDRLDERQEVPQRD